MSRRRCFLGAFDRTIIAAALPAIAGSLGGLSYLAWVVTAHLLAATIAAPLYGRLGDAFGRKRMLVWALGAWSIPNLDLAATPPGASHGDAITWRGGRRTD